LYTRERFTLKTKHWIGPKVAQQSVDKIISLSIMYLVTRKAGAKSELLLCNTDNVLGYFALLVDDAKKIIMLIPG
jgi:hypothetical protein